MVGDHDDIDDVSKVAFVESFQYASEHGISTGDCVPNLCAIWSKSVTIAVDIRHVSSDQLRPRSGGLGSNVLRARQIQQAENAVCLHWQYLRAIVFIDIRNRLVLNMCL